MRADDHWLRDFKTMVVLLRDISQRVMRMGSTRSSTVTVLLVRSLLCARIRGGFFGASFAFVLRSTEALLVRVLRGFSFVLDRSVFLRLRGDVRFGGLGNLFLCEIKGSLLGSVGFWDATETRSPCVAN